MSDQHIVRAVSSSNDLHADDMDRPDLSEAGTDESQKEVVAAAKPE